MEGFIRTNENFAIRTFQLWEYRVSHGVMLIRSPKTPTGEQPTNLDLFFAGVEYLDCPTMLRGLELAVATPNEIGQVVARAGPFSEPYRVFVLASGGRRHFVVAASCHVSENDDDIFDTKLI